MAPDRSGGAGVGRPPRESNTVSRALARLRSRAEAGDAGARAALRGLADSIDREAGTPGQRDELHWKEYERLFRQATDRALPPSLRPRRFVRKDKPVVIDAYHRVRGSCPTDPPGPEVVRCVVELAPLFAHRRADASDGGRPFVDWNAVREEVRRLFSATYSLQTIKNIYHARRKREGLPESGAPLPFAADRPPDAADLGDLFLGLPPDFHLALPDYPHHLDRKVARWCGSRQSVARATFGG